MRPTTFTFMLLSGLILFGASACTVLKYTGPDAPEWAVGTLRVEDPAVLRIAEVNGKTATGTLKGETAYELPDTVTLLPGSHSITPCRLNPRGVIYGDPVSFYAQAGNEYILRHKIKWDKSVRYRVECNGVDITTEN
ncbi:hypothetical protein [Desulfatiferula olefinivorans]